jgi:RNA polymerase sigma-70 factor (ECF subfamily)
MVDTRRSTPGSFDSFYTSEYGRVLALAWAATGSRQAGEDLTQDAFAAALASWERVSTLESPYTWVRRVVLNRSRSRWKKYTNERIALARNERESLRTVDAVPGDDVAWQMVRGLPRRQAQVFLLTYVEDVTLEQVGEALGMSPLTAKTHLQRARVHLRQQMEVTDG